MGFQWERPPQADSDSTFRTVSVSLHTCMIKIIYSISATAFIFHLQSSLVGKQNRQRSPIGTLGIQVAQGVYLLKAVTFWPLSVHRQTVESRLPLSLFIITFTRCHLTGAGHEKQYPHARFACSIDCVCPEIKLYANVSKRAAGPSRNLRHL